MSTWASMATAPRDGRPVWARGFDYGEPNNNAFCGWVYWLYGAWRWAGTERQGANVFDWLPAATPWMEPRPEKP